MIPRSLWMLCVFQAILLFFLVDFSLAQTVAPTVQRAPPTTKTTTEEAAREKFDTVVLIIVVVIVLVFVLTIIIVVVVSLADTRRPPPPRRTPPGSTSNNTRQSGSSHIPQTRSTSSSQGAYEANVIPNVYADGFQEDAKWWEIPDSQLKVYPNTVLGSGQFGVILLGDVIKNNKETKCAIKTLKSGASENEWRSLTNELQNMATMDQHPNIVNLIGAQTKTAGIFYVVVEYCANGDLYNYVKKHRTDTNWLGQKDGGTSIDYVIRLRIAFDVANGMSYMSTKGFIHRDLAARNVLLDGELRGKISDFGRSRDVRELFKPFQASVRGMREPVPTRWMPVETLLHQTFTTMSDVWSFGVLLWEIESGARRPYNDQTTYIEVVRKVAHEGYRLPQPSYCPDVIYAIMTECWKIDPKERPTFAQIAMNFSNLLQAHIPNVPHYSTLPPQ